VQLGFDRSRDLDAVSLPASQDAKHELTKLVWRLPAIHGSRPALKPART
jgi:hypothetical protein